MDMTRPASASEAGGAVGDADAPEHERRPHSPFLESRGDLPQARPVLAYRCANRPCARTGFDFHTGTRARARRRRRSAPRRLCRSPPSERAVRTTTGRRAWVGAASSSGRRRWRPGPKTRACSRPGAASRRDPRAPAEGPPLQPLGQPLPRRTRPPPGVACSPVLPLVASECASEMRSRSDGRISWQRTPLFAVVLQ